MTESPNLFCFPSLAAIVLFAHAQCIQLHAAIFIPITSDADSGISMSLTFTHAIDYLDINESPAVINGVSFTGEFAQSGGTYSVPAIEDDASGVTENIGASGNIAQLLSGFLFNSGGNASDIPMITLGGLVVGQKYEVRLYTRTWDVNEDRTTSIVFNAGPGSDDAITFDQDTNLHFLQRVIYRRFTRLRIQL